MVTGGGRRCQREPREIRQALKSCSSAFQEMGTASAGVLVALCSMDFRPPLRLHAGLTRFELTNKRECPLPALRAASGWGYRALSRGVRRHAFRSTAVPF